MEYKYDHTLIHTYLCHHMCILNKQVNNYNEDTKRIPFRISVLNALSERTGYKYHPTL